MDDKTKLQRYAEFQPFVKKDIADAISAALAKEQNQYGVPKVAYHVHNGIDSPVLVPLSITYIGFVPYDPTDDTLPYALPAGWSVAHLATGVYEITHNLGNTSDVNFYSFVADATQSTNQVCSPVISMFDNLVYAIWFDNADAPVDTSFTFNLTTGNNKLPIQPRYITRNMEDIS